ncbi:MAG: SIR2 family protein [Tistlia sp.]|uniref:SIR2 family protein n=1 Tax=Tistlia sp. TaxID=3057121 RepID=UPI0034A412A3
MTKSQHTHDALKALSDLRDHLARHDKPIAFFFGAGTSCSVRIPDPDKEGETLPLIPAVAGLTEICREETSGLGEKFGKAWTLIEENCKEIGQDPNVENILSRLRMMLNAVGNADSLSGLNRGEIETLEESVRKTIAKVVAPDLSNVPNDHAHRKFAQWLVKTSRRNPVEIFTVNYDVLIEHALEVERVPVFDGFVGSYQPFFHPDSLRRLETAPGANWTRLWKMHGSVTWRRIEQADRFRVVRGEPNLGGEMIYPSFEKYDESRQQPYSAFTDRLSRFLEQDDALLIVAGFSFGDEHINNLIFGVLENRPRTHVYALQYGELPDGNELIKRAHQRPNMIVMGPETGIIGGKRGAWVPGESPKSMAVAFEVAELEAPEGGEGATDQDAKSGLMKIGGFGSFCDFLESMSAS